MRKKRVKPLTGPQGIYTMGPKALLRRAVHKKWRQGIAVPFACVL